MNYYINLFKNIFFSVLFVYSRVNRIIIIIIDIQLTRKYTNNTEKICF